MVARKYKSGTRWCAWRWTDVVLNGELYLRRLHLVQTPWFSLMLHWIPRSDPQPDMHDHPVSFISWVIRGGYTERVPWSRSSTSGPHRNWERWSIHRMRATDQHLIAGVEPDTLTLVLAGPVTRSWGFHTAAGWVPWRTYSGTG